MRSVIICLLVILCNYIEISRSSFPNKENLGKYIRQGLDAVAQDVLRTKSNVMWHSYKFNTGIGNREELVVENIRSDDGFNIGQNVTEWQSINIRDKSYAVGKVTSGFTVLLSKLDENGSGFIMSNKILILNETPTAYTLYKRWNTEKMNYDIYLIVALASNKYTLNWFRITENNNLENFWVWKLLKKVTHLKIFETEDTMKLLLINEKMINSKTTTADIYDLLLEENNYKFWLSQSITLNCSSKTSAVNKFASTIYLSIPQQTVDQVQIYKFTNNTFTLQQIITSKHVGIVNDFKIGHRSFLAIGGLSSAIYQITNSGLVKQNIVDINFEEVTYYLPLPVKSYRDEIILLMQHHINYSSHVAPFIKVLTYSEGAFYVHDEIPCSFLGQYSSGATCLADPEREAGISGSAVVSLGKTLAVLVPRFQVESGLFYFEWKLKEVVNPIAKKVDEIIRSRIKVEKILQKQQKDIHEIERRLSNAINVNKDNEITGNWKVNTIVTRNIHNPNMQYSVPDDYSEPILFQPDFQIIADEIDSLQVTMLQKRSADVSDEIVFDYLKVNGSLDVQGPSIVENVFVSEVNNQKFDELVENCARRSENKIISGTKIFKQADVENIRFSKLNNISAKNFAYNKRSGIQVEGNVTFKNVLWIPGNVELFENGKVNDIDIKEELVYSNSETGYESIHFENLNVDHINYVTTINEIPMEHIINYKNVNQNEISIKMDYLDLSKVEVKAKQINGREFNSFMSSLCLRNTECVFKGNITIDGKMLILGSAEIQYLNDLKFPENYVRNQYSGFTEITGKKTFLGNVSATEVVVNGLVDGINPDEILTSTVAQSIPGNFTFSDLEVTESFTVVGDIFIGPNLTKFIPNPTLEDTKILNSNALFSALEVDGPVIVSNLINGRNVTNMLKDVVYKDEDIVKISAEKKFTKKLIIENNLNIDSNTINDININKIMTIDTKQAVSNTNISGKVIIENLEISGKMNDQDLSHIFEEFIRLDSDETIESEIYFKNTDDLPDIIAAELQFDRVNNMNISDFILTIGDRILENVEFMSVKADRAKFKKDIHYEIECFDIDKFAENRFSLTKDQIITAVMRINNGSVENIWTEQINDINWGFIKGYLNVSDIFSEKFFAGQFAIKDLNISQSLMAKHLNDKNMNDLFETAFWMNKTNRIHGEIEFEDDVTADYIKIKNLNGRNFEEFIGDVVLKTEKDLVLKGHKIFENGLTVENNLNTDKINEIKVENILLRGSEQEIFGNVEIHGDVWIENNLNVNNYINDFPIKLIKNRFEVKGDDFLLKGNVSFQNHITINNLHVKGKVNDVKPENYLNNIVCVADDIIINGTTIFKKKVRVLKNLGVATTIDGVDLNKVMEEVVVITSDDYIQGLAAFTETVEVTDTIELESDLETRFLCGCDVQDWLNKAVYIHDGYFDGDLKFEKVLILSNLDVDVINGVKINNLIPLHSTQTIDTTLNLGFVSTDNDIDVGNFVSGYKFEEEYQNTVMVNKEQELSSQLIFINPVTITNILKTSGFVNGKDLTRIVSTDTDQNLTASYMFNGKVTFGTDVVSSGKINDIDINDWKRRTVSAVGDEEQDIRDMWKVSGNVTFQHDVEGNGRLGEIDVKRLASAVAWKQKEKIEVENVIKNDYKDICTDVQKLVTVGKRRPFIFKYLEYHGEIDFDNDISAVHHFKYNKRHYLIVSLKHNCHSSLFEWIENSFKFTAKLRTGVVEQFITVFDSDRVYLVTKNKNSTHCLDLGVNVWIFNEDTLTHIYGLQHAVLLQKSKLPRTFYSMDKKSVTEYKLFYEDDNATVHAFKQWDLPQENYSFSPLDSKLEATMKNKVKRSYYEQDSMESDYEVPTIITNGSIISRHYLPASNVREFLVMEVGSHENFLKLTAVAVWEHATVQEKTDEIKIYEDFNRGKLFDKILTLRPSNLNVLQFDRSGDTFLVFLEDYSNLQVYEYKGLAGFKHRSTIKIEATEMITISLPVTPFQSKRKFLLLVNKDKLIVLQAIMRGDRPIESFHCEP